MKLTRRLLRSLLCCFCSPSVAITATATAATSIAIKNSPSASQADFFQESKEPPHLHQEKQEEEEEEDSLIDAASAFRQPPSPFRSLVVGTIYGQRRGHVSLCIQRDLSTPPPFLFELSIPNDLLASEMRSGILRVSLECDREPSSSSSGTWRSCRSGAVWKAYCNGRKVGYAVRRRPNGNDLEVLRTLQSVSAGAGVLMLGTNNESRSEQGEEVMYIRASYERVMGSRDSVSYHLINPGGSPEQEISVFLLRNR